MDDVALLASAQFDADWIDENQPVELCRTASRDLGGDPAAKRKPDHRDLAGKRVEHFAIEMDEVIHRVEILGPRRLAKARMRRRNDFAVLGEAVEKRRVGADRGDAVDEQDRPALAAPQHLEIDIAGPQPLGSHL